MGDETGLCAAFSKVGSSWSVKLLLGRLTTGANIGIGGGGGGGKAGAAKTGLGAITGGAWN